MRGNILLSVLLSVMIVLSSTPLAGYAQENTTDGGNQTVDPCDGVVCDDANPCTTDTCSAGSCSYTPIADDTSCGDGVICRQGTCQKEDAGEPEEKEPASVCGNGSCEDGENSDNCASDCPVPVETTQTSQESLSDYASSISVSSGLQSVADNVIGYINHCADFANGVDYYSIALECGKDAYYIKNLVKEYGGLSDSEWNNFADYIMLNSKGDPRYWFDGDGRLQFDHGGKDVVANKLNFGMWKDQNSGEGGADLWINWNGFGITDQNADAKRGRDDYWKWEEEQRKEGLVSQISTTLSGDSSSLATLIIADINELVSKAKAFESSPSEQTAYDLFYSARLMEGKFRGYSDSYSSSIVEEASKYAVLNGPGNPDVWQDEFGEVEVGGLWAFESSTRKGLRVRFDKWTDDYSGTVGMNLRAELSSDDTRTYAESIKKARRDAEDKARELEVAGKLKDYIVTFSISSENKETAKTLLKELESMVSILKDFKNTKDSAYNIAYKTELLRAKFEGIGQALECEELAEIGDYIILYSPGTVDIWEDEFGEQELNRWKDVYKDDTKDIRMNFNWWGCNDFEDSGSMGVDVQMGKEIQRTFADAIKKAREDARTEAEALRRQKLVLQARKEHTFSIAAEEIGEDIVEKLKNFKEEIISFESGEISAYKLHYDNIILRSEIEGIGEARRELAEEIGLYVILYGPGIPDVWKEWQSNELFVGHNLRIHETKQINFNFNRWVDDRNDFAGFNTWMDWGKLSSNYKEEIKKAEQEGWREAERRKRFAHAAKIRDELKDKVGSEVQTYTNGIREFISLVKKYERGEASAYDVELKRLQVSDLMRDVSEDVKDYIFVSDLGNDTMPPDIWLDFESGEIRVGNWRELVFEQQDKKFVMIAGMNGWCSDFEYVRRGEFRDAFECRLELNIAWEDWRAVRKDIDRANEFFWKQKREEELVDVLAGITSAKTSYSTSDQSIETELLQLITGVASYAEENKGLGVTDFQYNMLLQSETLNDKLDEASDQSIIILAGAESIGFHNYDDWHEELRSVNVYSDDRLEIEITFNRQFQSFIREEESQENKDYEVMVNVIWKSWEPSLKEQVDAAFEKYETERSAEKLAKLVNKRSEIVAEFSEATLKESVNSYESGEISMGNLRRKINALYFRLQAYDSELAYLAAASGSSYPEFTPIEINIETEHVKLKIYEKDFNYRFGGGVGVQLTKDALSSRATSAREVEFAPVDVQKEFVLNEVREGVEFDDEGNFITGNSVAVTGNQVREFQGPQEDFGPEQQFPGDEGNFGPQPTGQGGQFPDEEGDFRGEPQEDGNFQEQRTVSAYSEGVAEFIEQEKTQDLEDRKNQIQDIQQGEMGIFSDRREVRQIKETGASNARLTIQGAKAKLSLSITLTDAEITRLAEEVKTQWKEMETSGLLDDALYNLNMGLDNMPEIQEAIRSWGDSNASVRLRYRNQSVFELSFRTEDGNVAWINYGIVENAGSGEDNMYLEVDFESIMGLRNWWEDRLKNAEGIGAVITAVPAFGGKVVSMFVNGEITLKPFNTVFKIPKFLNVFFGAMAPTAGVDL